ncbi:hypothetical protein Trydic_g8133 [Trypoxylus dichotomus]
MNTHFHSYGGPELTSPHPPSPDNNNYHGHPGPGGPHMHPSNGHSMGPLGHPGGPHDPMPHSHHHPAFSSGGPPPGAPHHPHHSVNNNNNNNTVKVCAGCGGKIMERFLLHALDRYWHNGCLKCTCCSAMLADIGSSCFTKGGMILCKQDYMRLFGNSGACSACGQTIPASEFVMRSVSAGPIWCPGTATTCSQGVWFANRIGTNCSRALLRLRCARAKSEGHVVVAIETSTTHTAQNSRIFNYRKSLMKR